jgi:MFS transporter, ACS family, tartrate transporter
VQYSSSSLQVLTPESVALFAKVTRRFMPFLISLFLVAFLDRVNLGFAALTMNADLGIGPYVYGWGAGIFFIGYFFFEVPSNLALAKFGARVWIARIMITWGLISAATAFVRGPASFLVLRFLLGLAEAGFSPGIMLFLTYWYPARERARILALFYLAIPLANIIGAPISSLLLNLNGFGGLHGWQWLFIIEGLPAVVLAFVALGYLTNRPEEASWLSPDERKTLSEIMKVDKTLSERAYGCLTLREVFSHPRVLLFGMVYIPVTMGLYGLGFWLPQIVKRFGVSNLTVGLLATIPFFFAAIVQIYWCRHSDVTGERRWHFALPCLLMAGGFTMSAVSPWHYVSFLGLIFSTIGVMCAQPTFWTMPSAILTGAAAAGGLAIINSIGNLGGFVGPYVVGWVAETTKNPANGLIVLACALLMAAGSILVLQPKAAGEQSRKSSAAR